MAFWNKSKEKKKTNGALEITDANFEELILKADKPVLVDFWAPWCGPCRVIGPVVNELADEYEGKAVIGKINVDQNQVAAQLGVRSIPTLMFFKNGKMVERVVGLMPKPNLAEKLELLMD